MGCEGCDSRGASSDPFRREGFLPGVIGCTGMATSQVAIRDASDQSETQLVGEMAGLRSRTIHNVGTVPVAIGAQGVTWTTGYVLAIGAVFPTEYRGAIYGCTEAGAGDGLVCVWQESSDARPC